MSTTSTATVDLVEALSDPQAYPDPTGRVEMHQTHISWVFLTDSYAYKVKKPVRYDFLNFSTLDARRRDCEREVRVNRRLAANVYLGVQPIVLGEQGLRVGGSGETIEYCVQMRRLPDDKLLDQKIARREAGTADVERLLDVLCPFYARAAASEKISRHATPESLQAKARANFKVLEELADERLRREQVLHLRGAQYQFLALERGKFRQRIEAGKIRDCHGDLRAEHVCLLDPPVVFDSIEFADRFRHIDVIDELCFLAMDFDFLGSPQLGDDLLAGYRRRTGDDPGEDLIGFYKSYRACVRAKVEALRAKQLDAAGRADALDRAGRYLQLACSYSSNFYRPKLLVMVGLMGTGKSTVAKALTGELGLEVLQSDAVRKELAPRTRGAKAGYRQGIYTEEMTDRTYGEMQHRAAGLLERGVSVLLDATHQSRSRRGAAAELARRTGSEVFFVECTCPPADVISRLDRRRKKKQSISDGRPELYAQQAREFESTDELAAHQLIVVDTRRPVPELVETVIEAMRGCAGGGAAR